MFIRLFLLVVLTCCLLSACRNKTVKLLTKKWDCVQAENIIPPNTKFITPEDSAYSAQLQSIVPSINWTFKNNMRYECALSNRITVQGKYELLDNDKTLVCTPQTKNSINHYTIVSLSENELVLSSTAENTTLVLHFKPH